MAKFYVTLTWDNWPEGGSYGAVVEAEDYDKAALAARMEMSVSRAEDHELCYHCGQGTANGEGYDGLCGDCADRSSDDEGEKAFDLEPTDAGALQVLVDYGSSWHLVDCFELAPFLNEKVGGARFAKSVCALFENDNNWSVLDLDGAKEFFASIGFVPPIEATETGD